MSILQIKCECCSANHDLIYSLDIQMCDWCKKHTLKGINHSVGQHIDDFEANKRWDNK